ncbi:MAG: choice-of-anchor D domain-containing protein [Candidatus Binatus sp.]
MSLTASFAFGKVAIGQKVTKNLLTIKNTGAANSLIVSSASLSDPAEFSLSGTGSCGAIPITVAPRTKCTLGVSYSPNAVSVHSATLTIFDNAATNPQHSTLSGTGVVDISLSKTSLAFGSVKFGVKSMRSFRVTNHQTQRVSLSESFSGANAADFSVSGGTCGTTLAATSRCSIKVTFRPGALGNESATLTVSDSPDPLSPYTVALGTGPTIPATVIPATLAHGTLTKASKALNETVTNLSPFSLSLSESFSGANAGDFAVTGGTCGSTVLPASQCTIAVTFTPTAGGKAETAIMAVSVGNDPTSPHNISLRGKGP